MRIGILGGTFDPIHKGHMEMADVAQKELGLDEVWIMPAGSPPHKSGDEITSRIHRFELCELACASHRNCLTMYREFSSLMSKPNYTYLTMEALKREYTEDEFYFLMGQDSIDYFDKWREPQRILDACKIVVFLRGDSKKDDRADQCMKKIASLKNQFQGEILPIFYQPTSISSTELRTMLFDGATDEEVLPFIDEKELLYIRKFHLYEKKVEYDTKDFLQKLKEDLKPSRFTHTIGVADTAASLAMKYGYDMNRAYVSGLLHDCAKYMTNEQLMTYCKNNGLAITEGEIKAPHLLHAKAGEHMAKVKYGVEDEEILHAISVHTTGCPNMSLLDKILFVADYIEPNRDKAHRLQEIRELAFWNLDFAILLILEDTISYIEGKNQYLDQGTIDTFDYYLKEKNS